MTTRISPYFCIVLLAFASPSPSAADRVTLDDGRVLEGTIALLPGISVDPRGNEDAGSTVVMCDNGLTRTFISKKRIIGAADESGNQSEEEINVFQRVPDSGRRLSSIGTVVSSTPFDDFGRRVITLSTPAGLLDLVQGITKITPRWISVEGLITEHPLRLDMRIATSSVPRDTLRRIVEKQIDARDVDERLQFVRLLIQSARYKEAGLELHRVIEDFPSLKSLRSQRNNIANLAANQLLEEIMLRQRSGQDRLVLTLLENFSSEDGNGELLQAVKELRDEYRGRLDRANSLVSQLQVLTERLPDTRDRQLAGNVIRQISTELTFESLRRLSVYQRIGSDGQLPPEQALALAITGWLGGADSSQINLKLAISTASVSDLLRQYLVSEQSEERLEIRQRLDAEEAFDPKTVAAVAAHMVRPAAPSGVHDDGFFDIKVPVQPRELENSVARRCLVQLPPEYDARRRYPVIISLHSASTTPLQQIEWWAGAPSTEGRREGQAGRHGTIIVAPEWATKTQVGYRYSAKEHSVVLSALREVSRQFSVDSDRVYLSGHSMGGDAAWDIGLAHPDLWAGLISVSGKAGRYVHHYHQNAKRLPIYIVCGGLDHNTFSTNEMDLDRYLKKGFDLTYVEYRGRGHEHFSDELLKIFDWISRRTRTKFPKEIDAVSMRPWDRLFWWIEMDSPPQRTMVMPSDWPPTQFGRPFALSAKVTALNRVTARCGAEEVRVWLSPEIVDFQRPLTINIGTRRIHQGEISPDIDTLLEDLRSRCDYQHPFWAVVTNKPSPSQ
ncbi:MAG: peptidase [Planctomycetaceae bacterium]|nr:peptidase [Planctomycetaceae bacterium]